MIGLLVDTSRSQTGVLEPEREASHTFFDQGFTSYDQTSIGTAIEYAQREDTIIFSILFADRPKIIRGRSAMQRLARETGGACFEVSDAQPIAKIYSQRSFRHVTATLEAEESIQRMGPRMRGRLRYN
jgi:hypothetical protein